MNRDSFSQLANPQELQTVLEGGIKRNVPEGKKNLHYMEFSPLIALADDFRLNAEILTKNYTPQDVVEQDLFAKGKELAEGLKERLLNESLTPNVIELCNKVYDYLAEQDAPKKADLIFVFGAKTPLRIEKAIELYKLGLSERILVSGRGPHYANNDSATEAEIYAKIAMDQGVPKDAIILEDKSITVPDNVRASLNLLDEQHIPHSSIILVNSPYTQRRGWAHFEKYTPENVSLVRVNSETGNQYKRDAWYAHSTGIDVVLSEYWKGKVAVSLDTA